jgi:hypothetical protein
MAEADVPAPLPENVQEVLRVILDAGNTVPLPEDGDDLIAGPPGTPGRPVPCTVIGMLAMVAKGLVRGERDRLMTTRRGRHLARQGSMAGFDDSVTDIDKDALAAWARGEVDYLTDELGEAVEIWHHRIVLTREEALDRLLVNGVIPIEKARLDV